MSFNFTEIKETIRIKQGKIRINVITASGKDGEHFIVVTPSLLVSGYGNTSEEAQQSFKHNMVLFCKDLLALNHDVRDAELRKLGFVQEKLATKNFSKAYVDENGVLQGLEPNTKKVSMLEATL
jgi:hypothetical protein